MPVFDRLPKRKDGTTVTPWDKDWTNDVSRGIYEPRCGRAIYISVDAEYDPGSGIKTFAVPEPIKTGEKVDPGFMMMFTKGAYKELFDRLYGERK